MSQQTKITNAAETFIANMKDSERNLTFYEDNLYVYKGGAWDILRGKQERNRIEPTLMAACAEWGTEYSKSHGAIWRTIQTLTTDPKAKFDAKPYIACNNGTLAFDGRRLKEWNPKHYITRRFPFDYDERAKCPRWLNTLERILRDDTRDKEEVRECIRFLKQWFGINLVGPAAKQTRFLKKALFFVGPKLSAKSSVTEIFKTLIGTENISAMPLHKLSGEFGMADLVGRHAWIADDVTDSSKELDPNGFKVLVTGETVTANRKNKDHITFGFQGAILMSANSMPRIPDNSGAAFERMSVVKLKNKFTPEARERDLEGEKDLITYLKKHNEFPGIINWALDGFEEACDDSKFAAPKTIMDFGDMQRRNSNPIYDFVREGLIEDKRYILNAEAAAAIASEFAREKHHQKLSPKKAVGELIENIEDSMPSVVLEKDESGSRVTHFIGAKLTSDALVYWHKVKQDNESSLKHIDKPQQRRAA